MRKMAENLSGKKTQQIEVKRIKRSTATKGPGPTVTVINVDEDSVVMVTTEEPMAEAAVRRYSLKYRIGAFVIRLLSKSWNKIRRLIGL